MLKNLTKALMRSYEPGGVEKRETSVERHKLTWWQRR
jgi:hypothetical protein